MIWSKQISSQYNKLIIIKTGASETFRDDLCSSISLGEVLRTTMFFHIHNLFENIYFFTSEEALPLLISDQNISICQYSQLENYCEIFNSSQSLIVNLEKSCSDFLGNYIHLPNYIGFVNINGKWHLKNYLNDVRSIEAWSTFTKEKNYSTWGEQLLLLTGLQTEKKYGHWINGSPIEKKHDIGLNWQVGPKWKTKQLPMSAWKMIETSTIDKYKLSWQEGMENLSDYISWISSCKLLISNDSLGLHIAIALNIPVIAFFSTTSAQEIDHHGKVEFLLFEQNQKYDNIETFLKFDLDTKIRHLINA